MADEILDEAAIRQKIEAMRTAGNAAVSSVVSSLTSKIAAGFESGTVEGARQATSIIEKLSGTLLEELKEGAATGLATGIADGAKFLEQVARTAVNNFQEIFGDVFKIANIDTSALQSLGGELVKFGSEHPLQLGIAMKGDDLRRAIESSGIGKIETRLMEFSGRVSESFADFAGAGLEGMRSSEQFGNNIQGAMRVAAESMKQFGVSQEDALEMIQQMGRAGVDLNKVFDRDIGANLNIDLGKGIEDLNGLASVMLLAKGTGLGAAAATEYLAAATQEMGYTANEAVGIFGTFRQVQADSGLPMREVSRNLMEGADALKMYGGNVESVAALYKNFVDTMGEGNKLLAGDVFKSVINGLSNMNMSFRAFLGMTGEVGGFGSSGAIGAGLQVEKALETGEGLEGILASLKDTIRNATGADLMTRETAIETGQEQQFFMQREILGDFLKVSDPAQQNRIMEMLASNQQVMASDLAAGRDRATTEVGQTGRDVVDNTIGTIGQALNRTAAVGLQGIESMHQGYINLNKQSGEFVKNFIEPLMMATQPGSLASERALGNVATVEAGDIFAPGRAVRSVADVQTAANRDVSAADIQSAAASLNIMGRAPSDAGSSADWMQLNMRPPTASVTAFSTLRTLEQELMFKATGPLELSLNVSVNNDGTFSFSDMTEKKVLQLVPELINKRLRLESDTLRDND